MIFWLIAIVYPPACAALVAWWTARLMRYEQKPLSDAFGLAASVNEHLRQIVEQQQDVIAALTASLQKKAGVVVPVVKAKPEPANGNGWSKTERIVDPQDIAS